ncbi:MAG: hypothetical protein OXB99_08045 [Acidimicrobiaceae bacterium]|nr:hypothetical protein [Acidimicrobiaceae bacterium]
MASSLALLATACFDVEMDFLIHDDGSGSVTMTMRVDEAVLEFAALEEGGAAEDLCEEMLEDTDVDDEFDLGLSNLDSTAATFVEDGSCVTTTSVMWNADQSEEVLAAFAEDDGLAIRRLDHGGWRFEMETGSFEDEEFAPDDLEMVTALGFDLPTLTISVTLPGDAVEHNADSVSQSTYSWEIDLTAADDLPDTIYVETAPSGGGLGPAAIGAIVAGIVLALAALVTLSRRRQAKAADSQDAESDPEPADDENSETADKVSDPDEGSDDASDDARTDTPDQPLQ